MDPINDPPDPTEFPFAAHLGNDQFVLAHYGTWDATTPDASTLPGETPVASYLGQTTTNITVGEHYISPLGTHTDTNAQNSDCPTAAPGVVPINAATIEGTALFTTAPPFPIGGTTEGFVSCMGRGNGAIGQYIRVSSTVAFTFLVDCTVKGNVIGVEAGGTTIVDTPTVRVENVRVVIEGTMNPCMLAPPVELVQNPECALGPDGQEAGSRLETALEAVGPA